MNINVEFNITISTDIPTLLTLIDLVVQDLLLLVGKPLSEVEAVTFLSFKPGSTIMSGYTTVGNASATVSATSSMASALPGSTIAGIPVTSSSVVANGVDASGQGNDSKLALIIGLSVGMPLVIIILMGVIILVKKNREKKVDPEPQDAL